MSEQAVKVKRFYKDVSILEEAGRFVIQLDGRTAKTLGRDPLSAPTKDLAAAVAQEWSDQGELLERQTMPLTGLLSSAIDGDGEKSKWCQEIIDYLKSDLVCYRAEAPQQLAERQASVWEPYIEFMRSEFGAALVVTSGIVAIAQPDASIHAVRRLLEDLSAETLFALRIATAISGSAVLTLALWKQAEHASVIFDASRVDEHFQEKRWGKDDEAATREARLRDDFVSVDRFLRLL